MLKAGEAVVASMTPPLPESHLTLTVYVLSSILKRHQTVL
jgi:hypothetical protein